MWTVLGYLEETCKLTAVTGTCVTHRQPASREQDVLRSDDLQVVIDSRCLTGMSGGPWILGTLENSEDAKANGCQAAIPAADIICSISPRFGSDLFNPLGYELDPETGSFTLK